MDSRTSQTDVLHVRACRITHVITITGTSQLHFLTDKNAELASRN